MNKVVHTPPSVVLETLYYADCCVLRVPAVLQKNAAQSPHWMDSWPTQRHQHHLRISLCDCHSFYHSSVTPPTHVVSRNGIQKKPSHGEPPHVQQERVMRHGKAQGACCLFVYQKDSQRLSHGNTVKMRKRHGNIPQWLLPLQHYAQELDLDGSPNLPATYLVVQCAVPIAWK